LVECDFEAYMIDLNAFRDELNGDWAQQREYQDVWSDY
jgi:hypothetical protein